MTPTQIAIGIGIEIVLLYPTSAMSDACGNAAKRNWIAR